MLTGERTWTKQTQSAVLHVSTVRRTGPGEQAHACNEHPCPSTAPSAARLSVVFTDRRPQRPAAAPDRHARPAVDPGATGRIWPAAEIVIDGRNGMLVEDEAEMARATRRIDLIRPRVCRASVAERYDPSVAAAGYERSYRRATGVSGFHRMPDRARAVAGRDCPDQSRTGES